MPHEPRTSEADRRRTVVVLRERCVVLGLPAWFLDDYGRVILTPAGFGAADRWLSSSLLTSAIEEQTTSWNRLDGPLPAWSPSNGCFMTPLVQNDPGIRSGLAAVLGVTGEFLETDLFESVSHDVGLEIATAREIMAPLVMPSADMIFRLKSALGWIHGDLLYSDEHQMALGDLSNQLVFSYEQLNTLYRLGRAMCWLEEPHRFVTAVAEQLRLLHDFGWVAVVNVPTGGTTPGLVDDIVVSGELPCSAEQVCDATRELAARRAGDESWNSILEPMSDPLALMARSQLLAVPIRHDDVIVGMLVAGNRRGSDPEASSIEMQMIDIAAALLSAFHQNAASLAYQRSLFMGTVTALTAAIDAKDRYTRGHSERVAMLGDRIARAAGVDDEIADEIYISGLVHDVGKIGVPEATLCKPGALTDAEFALVKQHPVIGHAILKDIPSMANMLPGVLYHHERYDGAGYPHGLAGERIPLFGRILAVADAFDAMSSDRAYRARMSHEKVLRILREGSGTQWDPMAIEAFFAVDLAEYDAMIRRHDEQSRAA